MRENDLPPTQKLAKFILDSIHVLLYSAGFLTLAVVAGFVFLVIQGRAGNIELVYYELEWPKIIIINGHTPAAMPTQKPIMPTPGWETIELTLYWLTVEIPPGWTFAEQIYNVTGGNGYGPGHDKCSKVYLSSPSGNEVIRLSFVCDAIDAFYSPCPNGYSYLHYSSGYVRVPSVNMNSISYTTFVNGEYIDGGGTIHNGLGCLSPALLTVGDGAGSVGVEAIYYEMDKPRDLIADLSIPDRVILSLHK